MPNSVANVRLRGESSPSSFAIDRWDTTAWTAPDSAKPRTSGQRISQNMPKAVQSASPMLWMICSMS